MSAILSALSKSIRRVIGWPGFLGLGAMSHSCPLAPMIEMGNSFGMSWLLLLGL